MSRKTEVSYLTGKLMFFTYLVMGPFIAHFHGETRAAVDGVLFSYRTSLLFPSACGTCVGSALYELLYKWPRPKLQELGVAAVFRQHTSSLCPSCCHSFFRLVPLLGSNLEGSAANSCHGAGHLLSSTAQVCSGLGGSFGVLPCVPHLETPRLRCHCSTPSE